MHNAYQLPAVQIEGTCNNSAVALQKHSKLDSKESSNM